MKNLLFAILLLLPCISISQNINTAAAETDSITIPRSQVPEIYKGLKRGEDCETELQKVKEIAFTLNQYIQNMNKEVSAAATEYEKLNTVLALKNSELAAKEVQIQVLKDRVTPWYRHPATIGIAAFALGVLIAK